MFACRIDSTQLKKSSTQAKAQSVEDSRALLSIHDQAGTFQLGQMARDRRDVRSDRVGQFTDAQFTVLPQPIDDEQSSRMRQRLDDSGSRFELCLRF